jgi:hypothetical protein
VRPRPHILNSHLQTPRQVTSGSPPSRTPPPPPSASSEWSRGLAWLQRSHPRWWSVHPPPARIPAFYDASTELCIIYAISLVHAHPAHPAVQRHYFAEIFYTFFSLSMCLHLLIQTSCPLNSKPLFPRPDPLPTPYTLHTTPYSLLSQSRILIRHRPIPTRTSPTPHPLPWSCTCPCNCGLLFQTSKMELHISITCDSSGLHMLIH